MIQFLNLKKVASSGNQATLSSIANLYETSGGLATVMQRRSLLVNNFGIVGLHLSYKAQVDFPVISYIGVAANGSTRFGWCPTIIIATLHLIPRASLNDLGQDPITVILGLRILVNDSLQPVWIRSILCVVSERRILTTSSTLHDDLHFRRLPAIGFKDTFGLLSGISLVFF